MKIIFNLAYLENKIFLFGCLIGIILLIIITAFCFAYKEVKKDGNNASKDNV